MPLPGGASGKLGDRYEVFWMVSCMLDVMDEKAKSIRLEKPGEDAFEFFLCQGSRTKCYQVKQQITGRGRWTLSALEDKETHVLSDFWEALKNPHIHCVFTSTQAADELEELAYRARSSISFEEFEEKCLNKTWSGNFKTLCKKWDNCSEKEAYEALKRVYVETVAKIFLVDTIENRIASLVEGDPKTIRCELAELALEKIHHQLTAWDIWHYLTEERKYRRREWHKDPHVLVAVENVNKIYFDRFEHENIAGEIITRDEVSLVVDKLTSSSSEKRGVLLTGEAGVGKSGVIGQVVKELKNRALPILAFRIDRLQPTEFPDTLGEQLRLPGSPSIVLGGVAQDRDCVLIIDQVDAVSQASGRNPSFFECIDQIIRQAETFPNIRLLLACRKFDVDNDSRIRRLTDKEGIVETVSVNKLTYTKVKEICSKLGLDVARLNQKQQNLLSVPLHLSLLAEIIEDKTINVLNFKTAKDLLDKFCHSKRNKLRERLGYSIEEKWTQVIDGLCEYMSGKQTLSAPKTTVRSFKDTVDFMVSEHILTKDNGRISFFHESFFDYAFADKFSDSGTDLLSFLTSDEQHLFRRAQVRQILLHQRDNDFEIYLDDLEKLLTSSDIRLHIKQVVLALLINLEDPKQEEWEIIAPLLNDSYPLKDKVWQIFYSSVSWFKLLDDLNVIHDWLNSGDEELIERLSILLSIIQRQLPDRVAEIVEPYIGVSDAWQKRLIMLVHKADIAAGRGFFELFLRLIDEGILDEVKYPMALKSDFWNLIYSLPKKHPDWSCEVIGHYLNRRLNISIANNQPNPFDPRNGTIPNSQFAQRIFMDSAKNSPEAFVENVLPFMIRVMELTAYKDNDVPRKDAVWGCRTYGSSIDTTTAILEAMEIALSSLAAEQPEIFANFVNNQLYFSEFETIQYLLIRAYTANGKRFADEAINHLCQRPTRFNTGYLISTGNSHAAIFWASKELLEATTPYCSDECLEELEKTLLNYYPAWEKNHKFLYSRGYGQCVLLSAIVPSRCSETITRKLEELERKFIPMGWVEAPGKIEPPESPEVYTIGSPIPEEGSEKMTDEQWLKAIATYNNELSEFKNGKGGAGELSRVLEKQVKQEPLRFASLIKQCPNDANRSYFNAVLQGIAETEESVDIEVVRSVCQHCHQLPQHPCGRSISWLFGKLPELPWTVSDFEILIYYALNDPDPEQEFWRTKTPSGDVYYGGDILMAGINSTRGSAVSSIARLMFADQSRASHFSNALEQIVKDSSTAVRLCAASALTAMLNYDREMAVSLFLELCNTDEELLGTKTVEHFLYYTLQTHFQELKPVLEKMIASELPEVVITGARQACLLSLVLVNDEANDLAKRCLSGTENHRISAAEIFIANLRSAYFREFCESSLIQLFNDSDEKVRDIAATCFRRFEGEELGSYINLIEAFVHSQAFKHKAYDLIYGLEKTTAKLPEITLSVCEKFIENLDPDTGSTDIVSKLLIRIYSQSKKQDFKKRCLDIVDKMAQGESNVLLYQALQQFER